MSDALFNSPLICAHLLTYVYLLHKGKFAHEDITHVGICVHMANLRTREIFA